MKKIAAYLFFLFSLFAGCVNEHVGESPSLVVIRGGQIQCAGRAAEENTRFQAGDVISFFSQGGIEADNVCLTYENGVWKHGGALSWNTSGKDASFTAFYPCFESGDWDYYDEDGFLEDIIYAKGEVSSGMFIELGFQHLFSKIIFEVDGEMNEQIQHITFTPSVQIESVLPLTGEFVLTGTPAEPFWIEKQSDGIYSFFVPSAHEVTIDIQITTSEGKQLPLATTASQSYQSGYQYTYHLAPEVHEVGIYTVEDFIAFTHLINGMSYPGRTLDEFGETVDGRTTYYLRNDLHFTEETSKEVQPIGFRSSTDSRNNWAFKDCFDGGGYTLRGLQIITVDKTSSQGLFAYIDGQGVVKNLNMENCSYVNANINNTTQRVGILAGWNEGTIIGCHIKGGKIENKKYGNAGGMVCNNKGRVLNCVVNDMQFIGNAMYVGGFCYDNSADKDIINCCVAQCSFMNNDLAGGLCYNVSADSNILNCYVFSLDAENTDAGVLFYKGNKGSDTTINCYYQGDVSLKPIYNTFTYKGAVYAYDSDFTVTDKGCSLLEALNGWVEDNQGKYSGYSLDYWQKGDENIPFIHQSSQ